MADGMEPVSILVWPIAALILGLAIWGVSSAVKKTTGLDEEKSDNTSYVIIFGLLFIVLIVVVVAQGDTF